MNPYTKRLGQVDKVVDNGDLNRCPLKEPMISPSDKKFYLEHPVVDVTSDCLKAFHFFFKIQILSDPVHLLTRKRIMQQHILQTAGYWIDKPYHSSRRRRPTAGTACWRSLWLSHASSFVVLRVVGVESSCVESDGLSFWCFCSRQACGKFSRFVETVIIFTI